MTTATSEGALGIFSKITVLISVHSNQKDEICHSFLVEIFTKSFHRGEVGISVGLNILKNNWNGCGVVW